MTRDIQTFASFFLCGLCLLMIACGQDEGNTPSEESQNTLSPQGCLLADEPAPGMCGHNGQGQEDVYCQDEAWVTRCNDPDRCKTGDIQRSGGLCPNGTEETGTVCEGGQWKPTCLALEQGCDEGDTRQNPNRCGDRGEFTQNWFCEDNTWQPGACGDTQQTVSCGGNVHHGDFVRGRNNNAQPLGETPVNPVGITHITGNLIIANTYTENLAEFSSLRCVDGEIFLESVDGITTLENLGNLQSTASIVLSILPNLQSTQGLERLKSLQRLVIRYSGQEKVSLAPMRQVSNLAHLELTGDFDITSPSDLPFSLQALVNLHLYTVLDDLGGLEHIHHLNYLTLFLTPTLEITGLHNLETVIELGLWGQQFLGAFDDPTPFTLPNLQSVRHLVLRYLNRPVSFPNLTSIEGEAFVLGYPFEALPNAPNLHKIGEKFSIIESSTTNLDAWSGLRTMGSIEFDNTTLEDVGALLMLEETTGPGLSASIRNHGPIEPCQLVDIKSHLSTIGFSSVYVGRNLPTDCP